MLRTVDGAFTRPPPHSGAAALRRKPVRRFAGSRAAARPLLLLAAAAAAAALLLLARLARWGQGGRKGRGVANPVEVAAEVARGTRGTRAVAAVGTTAVVAATAVPPALRGEALQLAGELARWSGGGMQKGVAAAVHGCGVEEAVAAAVSISGGAGRGFVVEAGAGPAGQWAVVRAAAAAKVKRIVGVDRDPAAVAIMREVAGAGSLGVVGSAGDVEGDGVVVVDNLVKQDGGGGGVAVLAMSGVAGVGEGSLSVALAGARGVLGGGSARHVILTLDVVELGGGSETTAAVEPVLEAGLECALLRPPKGAELFDEVVGSWTAGKFRGYAERQHMAWKSARSERAAAAAVIRLFCSKRDEAWRAQGAELETERVDRRNSGFGARAPLYSATDALAAVDLAEARLKAAVRRRQSAVREQPPAIPAAAPRRDRFGQPPSGAAGSLLGRDAAARYREELDDAAPGERGDAGGRTLETVADATRRYGGGRAGAAHDLVSHLGLSARKSVGGVSGGYGGGGDVVSDGAGPTARPAAGSSLRLPVAGEGEGEDGEGEGEDGEGEGDDGEGKGDDGEGKDGRVEGEGEGEGQGEVGAVEGQGDAGRLLNALDAGTGGVESGKVVYGEDGLPSWRKLSKLGGEVETGKVVDHDDGLSSGKKATDSPDSKVIQAPDVADGLPSWSKSSDTVGEKNVKLLDQEENLLSWKKGRDSLDSKGARVADGAEPLPRRSADSRDSNAITAPYVPDGLPRERKAADSRDSRMAKAAENAARLPSRKDSSDWDGGVGARAVPASPHASLLRGLERLGGNDNTQSWPQPSTNPFARRGRV